MKTEMDVELLLRWAYRDELSKRQLSAAEGIWDRINDIGQRGGIDDPGHGSAQRYAHFGLPDADAELIEREVSWLEDTVIDWEQSFDSIAPDLSGLISVNDMARREQQPRQPKGGWGQAGNRALTGFWGAGAERPVHDRPRDVMLLGGLRTAALVTMHAIKGTRPDWHEESPRPSMVQALKGPNAKIEGECKGRNLYSVGSYCPLKWEPSPLSIVSARAEYVAWHHGLRTLCENLSLAKFIALRPKASATPWLDLPEREPPEPINIRPEKKLMALPLGPHREVRGHTAPRRKSSPVRYPLACG